MPVLTPPRISRSLTAPCAQGSSELCVSAALLAHIHTYGSNWMHMVRGLDSKLSSLRCHTVLTGGRALACWQCHVLSELLLCGFSTLLLKPSMRTAFHACTLHRQRASSVLALMCVKGAHCVREGPCLHDAPEAQAKAGGRGVVV